MDTAHNYSAVKNTHQRKSQYIMNKGNTQADIQLIVQAHVQNKISAKMRIGFHTSDASHRVLDTLRVCLLLLVPKETLATFGIFGLHRG